MSAEEAKERETAPIRLAGAADAPAFGRLLHAFNVEFGDPTPAADVIAERAAPLFECGEVTVLLAGEGPDGFAELRFRPSLYTGVLDAYLEELYVVPERRGRRRRSRRPTRRPLPRSRRPPRRRARVGSTGATSASEAGSEQCSPRCLPARGSSSRAAPSRPKADPNRCREGRPRAASRRPRGSTCLERLAEPRSRQAVVIDLFVRPATSPACDPLHWRKAPNGRRMASTGRPPPSPIGDS